MSRVSCCRDLGTALAVRIGADRRYCGDHVVLGRTGTFRSTLALPFLSVSAVVG